jgi:hypothetical protein
MAWRRPALTSLLFAALGPAIGLGVFVLLGGGSVWSGDAVSLLAIFAYGIGGLPAALAGLIFALAWRGPAPIPKFGAALSGLLLGAASGVVAFAAVALAWRGAASPAAPGVWLIPMVAGAVCGVVAYRLHVDSDPAPRGAD